MENNQLERGGYLLRIFIESHCSGAVSVLFYAATNAAIFARHVNLDSIILSFI